MKLKDAIEEYGTQTKLCKELNLCRMSSFYWGYWLPKKHAQDLNFKFNNLSYDHALYSGKIKIKVGKKEYSAAADISSRQVLKKEVIKGSKLFFYRGKNDLVAASDLSETDLYSHFREHPIYREV